MTDRHDGYLVILEDSIREDDAEELVKLLRNIRGVLTVKPVVGGLELMMATERARSDLETKLWKVLHEEVKT